jgi:ABC-type cobalamin/Fe3+-siderophores transport system ATPase subunit
MITKISFKSGASPQSEPIELEPTSITVFVGPNNSGKSQVLIELEDWSRAGGHQDSVIIDDVLFAAMTREQVLGEIQALKTSETTLGRPDIVTLRQSIGTEKRQIYLEGVIEAAQDPITHRGPSAFAELRRFFTLRLDGQTRLNLLKDSKAGDLQEDFTSSTLEKLFRNNDLRTQVRQIINDAIGRYLVIDPTLLGQLRVRFSNRAPASEGEERGITAEAVAFHRAADPIAKVSDGIRAFAGIITTLIAGDPKVILIDEPEAFLHPALAMKLGKEMGRSANDPNKRLFVSTHSASFIMGCIQSGSPINIVRLTYKDGIGTTRVLEPNKLLHLMRNPMLRSTGVIEGLFFEAVVVTEADADRAFYQEVNERLRSTGDSRGINNCLFLNAQNKQTVWDIVQPLRELGIPAVGIIDLDMVKDQGTNFGKIMKGAFVPEVQHSSMGQLRGQLNQKFNEVTLPAGKTTWKNLGGINLLGQADKQGANNFFDQLEQYGVFVVRVGELEDWLPSLGVSASNKKEWLPAVFTAMGEDPNAGNYVRPIQGDVWDFVGQIKNWFDNPTRLGIPS